MTCTKVEAANKAIFSMTMIAYTLKALGSGEQSIDPGVVSWLGQCLVDAGETIESAVDAARAAGAA
jgi:hypothetical protein